MLLSKMAPVGVPIVRVAVSTPSYVLSPRTVKLAVPVIRPAAIVMEVGTSV